MQTWNLDDLYSSVDDPAIAEDMATTEKLMEGFVADYAAGVDSLLDALRRYEQIIERMEKLFEYAQMVWATDTRNGALMVNGGIIGLLARRGVKANVTMMARIMIRPKLTPKTVIERVGYGSEAVRSGSAGLGRRLAVFRPLSRSATKKAARANAANRSR